MPKIVFRDEIAELGTWRIENELSIDNRLDFASTQGNVHDFHGGLIRIFRQT